VVSSDPTGISGPSNARIRAANRRASGTPARRHAEQCDAGNSRIRLGGSFDDLVRHPVDDPRNIVRVE